MKYLILILSSFIMQCTPSPHNGKYTHLYTLAHLKGDSTHVNIVADYSESGAEFVLAPKAPAAINRVLISMSGEGLSNSGHYGNLLTELKEGIEIHVKNSEGEVIERLTPYPITTNGDWAAQCYDLRYYGNTLTGEDYLALRWTFGESGQPIVLLKGEYISINVQDNFERLKSHQFLFQGYYN